MTTATTTKSYSFMNLRATMTTMTSSRSSAKVKNNRPHRIRRLLPAAARISFPLFVVFCFIVLCSLQCHGFVVLETTTRPSFSVTQQIHERRESHHPLTVLCMSMDPYEQQYQQWYQSAAQQQEQQQQQATSTENEPASAQSDLSSSSSPPPLQSSSSTITTAQLDDPYERQLQQYSTNAHQHVVEPVPTEPQLQPLAYQAATATATTTTSHPGTLQEQQQQSSTSSHAQQQQQQLSLEDFLRYSGSPSSSPNTAPLHDAIPISASNVEQSDIRNGIPRQQMSSTMQTSSELSSAQLIPPQLTEKGDEYLNMVSTEVQVKKFLNQNPYSWTDIPINVIMSRFLDFIEDSTQKRNGKIKGQSKIKGKDAPKQNRKTIVVLGTGWAAHAFIKVASTYDLRIVVVSPVNHFVFTPMLASAAVGTIEYRSMTEPIRVTNPFIDNYVEGRAIGIDVEEKQLAVQLSSLGTVTGTFKGIAANAPCKLEPEERPAPEPESSNINGAAAAMTSTTATSVAPTSSNSPSRIISLSYDYLVCAVGTASRSSIVPGAKEHCFNLKTAQDSKRLRTAIGEALEYASRPDVQPLYYPNDPEEQELATLERQRRVRIVLVGGGPTGVEMAGELSDFFRQVCRKPDGAFQHLHDDISVILVHGGSELLPAMDTELRERALEALKVQGVEVRLNTRLQEVGRDFVRLLEKGRDEEETETIPVGITVWAAGNAPVPFVQELLSKLPESAAGSAGRINVDRWLRCPMPTPETFGSILVLGDVANREAQSKYEIAPKSLPQTAQVAGQQGAYAARLLNRGYDLTKTPPRLPAVSELELAEDEELSFLRIWLWARGLEEAPEFNFLSLGLLAYVGGEEALNQVAIGDVPIFNYAGKVAFILWRSVYLAKQASTRNQALISFDWLRTEAFGRDITRL